MLDGFNSGLNTAIEKNGAPRHIISDQASVFTGRGLYRFAGATEYNATPGSHRKTWINFGYGESDQNLEI